MDIALGAEVNGTEDKLGEVSRVIVNAGVNRVTDLVVKHGFLFAKERIVPLGLVKGVDDGVVRLDLDEKGFEALDGYSDDEIRGRDPDYTGPPGFDSRAGDPPMDLDVIVAEGSNAGLGLNTKPGGYPGGEDLTPRDLARPTIQAGTDILDANGEKVGDMGELSFAVESGAPTRITMRRGLILHHDVELPVAWIANLSDQGVVLTKAKAEIETALGEAR